MEDKMKTLKQDPELKHIIEELESGGPAAMMKCVTSLSALLQILFLYESSSCVYG